MNILINSVMSPHLERILRLESANTNLVHLFRLPSGDSWVAYEQSAVNLQSIIPGLKETMAKEDFPEADIWLHRVVVDDTLIYKYSLPLMCTLVGDDYLELSPGLSVREGVKRSDFRIPVYEL
ncbi:hypothetical protein DWW69_19880 [Bacteroides sp. AF16-49]|uniref:hypothetical protein n=1 Tax=Bacteroides sp. AF16-49 TaxID=2292192 RepID=UPI000EFE0376|nr:hypothetical protein [Bacteroides sp. AF16-49]RHR68513.1 hypothetical protein DWW69_19880 [Bacteroides sp. AF16-49]